MGFFYFKRTNLLKIHFSQNIATLLKRLNKFKPVLNKVFFLTILGAMGNLMGKSEPKSRITEQDRAVLGLKQQRDKLNQYKKRIEGNLDRERQVAKELLKHNKRDKARALLKKKR